MDEVAGRRRRTQAFRARNAAGAQAATAKSRAVPAKADGDAGSAKAAAAKAEAASAMAGVTSAKRGAAKRGPAKRGVAKRRAAEPASDATQAHGTAPEVDAAEPADADALRPESPELLSGREADAPAAGRAQTGGAAEEPVAAAGGTHGEIAGAAASRSEGLSAAEQPEAPPATTNVLASLGDEDEAGGCDHVWYALGLWCCACHRPPVASNDEGSGCNRLCVPLIACTEDKVDALCASYACCDL